MQNWGALNKNSRQDLVPPGISGQCYARIPSDDKSRHGFDGQKWAHTASSPLTIRQVFSAGLSLSGRISAPAKLPAPDRNGFSSDFCFLRRRWAGAHQGEKSKKRRKDALSGVFALVKRWYICNIAFLRCRFGKETSARNILL